MANSRPTVLVTELEYRKAEASFVSAPGLVCVRAPDDEGELAAAIRESHASSVVVGPRPYSGPLYEALPAGGVIARFGVGHDGIDKTKATAAGLICTNTPGVLNQSVAEHTMLLIGAAARRLIVVARHAWEPAIGEELQGKTLAIIGCGGIGQSVARIASLGYGMRVVGCSSGVPPPRLEHFADVTNDFTTAVRHRFRQPAHDGES
jgi:lactate dehydrogenase-like 2-hydroxyacid dehydrogenase